jgi:hypothetical protein
MPRESVNRLTIGTLKAILFENHVSVGVVLEKGDLVNKVLSLVEEERRSRAREAELQRLEEEEILRRQREMMEQHERERQGSGSGRDGEDSKGNDTGASHSSRKGGSGTGGQTTTAFERNGLCVVCQDDEACIAIVDCGCVISIS